MSLLPLIGKTQAEMPLSGQDPGLGEGKGKQVVSASMPQKAPKGCFSSMKCAICFTVSDTWKVLPLGAQKGTQSVLLFSLLSNPGMELRRPSIQRHDTFKAGRKGCSAVV